MEPMRLRWQMSFLTKPRETAKRSAICWRVMVFWSKAAMIRVRKSSEMVFMGRTIADRLRYGYIIV